MRTIHEGAFDACHELKRIALPLKDNIIQNDVFNDCYKLTTVDLVGGIQILLPVYIWRDGEVK